MLGGFEISTTGGEAQFVRPINKHIARPSKTTVSFFSPQVQNWTYEHRPRIQDHRGWSALQAQSQWLTISKYRQQGHHQLLQMRAAQA